MRTLPLLLVLVSLSAHAEAPLAARCEVRSASLTPARSMRDLLVDSAGTRTIAIALGEPGDGGTYLTFAHLNLGLARALGETSLTLNVTDSVGNQAAVGSDSAHPLWRRISFPSRVSGPRMEVELRCEELSLPYVLRPTFAYNADPVFGVQYVATTISNQRANFDRFYAGNQPSRGEYLASAFCVDGDAAALASEMRAEPSLWRADVQDHRTPLVPASVRAENGSVTWEQPAQQIVCLASHEERQIDPENGTEETVTVCDRSEKRNLTPVRVSIRACQ